MPDLAPSPGVQLATWWQAYYTGPLLWQKGRSAVAFCQCKASLDLGLPSLPAVLLISLSPVDVAKRLTHRHGAPHNTLIKELTSQQMKCDNEPMCVEFAGLSSSHGTGLNSVYQNICSPGTCACDPT